MSHIIETATNPIGLKKSMATLRKNYSVPVCLTHMQNYSMNIIEINIYGNIYENNACPRCGKIFPIEYIKNSDKVPLCDVCKSTVIHPGVYLHGEMLSNTVISHAVEEVAKADTILVLGMNLNSSLCKDMLPHFTGKDLIVIHKEPHYLDEKATAAYHGAVSEILPEVAESILDA